MVKCSICGSPLKILEPRKIHNDGNVLCIKCAEKFGGITGNKKKGVLAPIALVIGAFLVLFLIGAPEDVRQRVLNAGIVGAAAILPIGIFIGLVAVVRMFFRKAAPKARRLKEITTDQVSNIVEKGASSYKKAKASGRYKKYEALKTLGELKATGVISEDEFETEKRKILNELKE